MEQKLIVEKTSCRICGNSSLIPIFSLGKLFNSDFVTDEQQKECERFPLDLVLCDRSAGGCSLLQLTHTISPEVLYRRYWYRSGVNRTMTDELLGIARKAELLVGFKSGDYLIDIGSNDGTLFKGISAKKAYLVGYEPSRNIVEYVDDPRARIINDFFDYESWARAYGNAKAKIITAIAMFYDLDEPNKFVSDIAKCLDDEGVFIIQMSYLPLMLSQNNFDNIGHEHLEHYALYPLEYLMGRNGLEMCDVEVNDINGGSFRIYICHKGKGKTIRLSPGARERILAMRRSEEQLGLSDRKIYDAFVKRVLDLREKLVTFITREVASGKKVYVYGASNKGNILLQFYDLRYPLIAAAAERNPDKWGLKTVGTMIPIISEEQARREQPDYFLVLPWHFLAEFKEREAEYLRGGGKFIVPLPEFEIVGAEHA